MLGYLKRKVLRKPQVRSEPLTKAKGSEHKSVDEGELHAPFLVSPTIYEHSAQTPVSMSSWDNTKDYQDGNLSTAVVEYLREVPVISIEDYLDFFCPPLPGSLDLDSIVRRLSQPLEPGVEAALDLSTSTPSWRWYRNPPEKQSPSEPQVSSFQEISQAVTSACIELDDALHPTSRLRCLGEGEELKGDFQSSNKPDAIHIGADLGEYFSAEEQRGQLWWDHAAVLYEFKKRDSDADALDVRLSSPELDPADHSPHLPTGHFEDDMESGAEAEGGPSMPLRSWVHGGGHRYAVLVCRSLGHARHGAYRLQQSASLRILLTI